MAYKTSGPLWTASASSDYRRDLEEQDGDCALRCFPSVCPYLKRTGSEHVRRNQVRAEIVLLRLRSLFVKTDWIMFGATFNLVTHVGLP